MMFFSRICMGRRASQAVERLQSSYFGIAESWTNVAGTPESHPCGFRKGTVIRDNDIYCTGRTAISFTGDGEGRVVAAQLGWVGENHGLAPQQGSPGRMSL